MAAEEEDRIARDGECHSESRYWVALRIDQPSHAFKNGLTRKWILH